MDIQISAFLLFVLFTAGHSLSCYQCWDDTRYCMDLGNITCPNGSSGCMSETTVWKFNSTKVKSKYCTDYCASGSWNTGFAHTSYSCCDTDLCNLQDAPDPSTNTTNGKKCYYCDGQNCSNTVNCSGSEDHCFTVITVNFNESETTIKGCISNSSCDNATTSSSLISCCEGDLCNIPQNVTQNITQNINVTQNIPQNINVTQNITQNINVTQNITQGVTQKVPQSTNSAKSITQSFLLLLIVYLISQKCIIK
ncbi:urokinase plasminogen activator surface receptor-like [Carassius auratus]|uniref:Urokinase plasminogen activator surface receptor-like n=1 Tax=Carassius auratus TaxID=7957 RepID=A0A6P6NCS0_CARAU|nr:urokinase plasminogen activator surface receptor-like [Carassius auratus]